MLNLLALTTFDKPIKVNGTVFENAQAAWEVYKQQDEEELTVELNFVEDVQEEQEEEFIADDKFYRVKVRQWMTKQSVPGFDWMSRWNDDVPMPFRIMVGQVLEETKTMVWMELHARPERTTHCMRCCRKLTHPVSLLYGIGPECGGHAHINPYNTEEELMANLEEVRGKLEAVKWEGWIAKSAIEEFDEIGDEQEWDGIQ